LSLGGEDCRETISVASIINHPEYRWQQNDISILILEQDSLYQDYALPLFTHQPGISDLEKDGQMLTVSGWGRTSEGGQDSNVLQKAEVPVVSNAQCQQDLEPYTIHAGELCAGYPAGGIDACQNDSGGPLVGTDSEYGDKYLVGVVSWGLGCARRGKPGVYARVSEYQDWICLNTGGVSGCGERYGFFYWVNVWWSYFYFVISLLTNSYRSSAIDAPLSTNLPAGVLSFPNPAASEAMLLAREAVASGRRSIVQLNVPVEFEGDNRALQLEHIKEAAISQAKEDGGELGSGSTRPRPASTEPSVPPSTSGLRERLKKGGATKTSDVSPDSLLPQPITISRRSGATKASGVNPEGPRRRGGLKA
jgi:hypothetical protein